MSNEDMETIAETKHTTIERSEDGTVEYMDEASTETFKSIEDCRKFLREMIETGGREWWVDEARELLGQLESA